jgi:hypothetical protein
MLKYLKLSLLIFAFAGNVVAQKKAPKQAQASPPIIGTNWSVLTTTNFDGKIVRPKHAMRVNFSKDAMGYNPDCNSCGRSAKVDEAKKTISFNADRSDETCTLLACLGDSPSYQIPYETLTYTQKGDTLSLEAGRFKMVLVKSKK